MTSNVRGFLSSTLRAGRAQVMRNQGSDCWQCGQIEYMAQDCPNAADTTKHEPQHFQSQCPGPVNHWAGPENPTRGTQLPMLTSEAKQEPMLQVQLN